MILYFEVMEFATEIDLQIILHIHTNNKCIWIKEETGNLCGNLSESMSHLWISYKNTRKDAWICFYN
jgi:hypothetical protein